ncbi:MAG: 50S ribosomal protein L1 [Thermoplasmata archaeon]|nr:50S ribosomal protein L1 [Thermoplasmata archaeon]
MPDRTSIDAVTEALGKAPERGFSETVEIAVNLKELDLTIPKNRLEEEIALPNGRGRPVKVGLFGSNELCEKVKGVADVVINPNQLDEAIKNGKQLVKDVDFFLAEAPLMPTIGKRLGTILGPRGKMPRPVPPGSDPSALIQSLKRSVKVRSKGNRTFHAAVGNRSMPPEQIAVNIDAVLARIVGKLERGRNNIDSVYVKTTMGPAVRIW